MRPLGDLCAPERGITYGIVKVGEYVPGGIPVIRGGDIRENRIEFNDDKRVSREVSSQFQRTILKGGEIVLNLIAEPGHCAVVPMEMQGFNVSRDVAVIGLGEAVDHRFVCYVLKSPQAVSWLTSRLQGSVTQKINLATLRDVPVPLPPRWEQAAIADILGALDDKIDVNLLVADRCHQLASAALNETLLAAGACGDLEAVRLSDIAAVNRRQTRPEHHGTIRYLDISSVGDGKAVEGRVLAWEDAPSRARRLVTDGDTLWSTVRPNRRSHCLILDPSSDLVVSTGFAVLTPTTVGPSLLYGLTERPEFEAYLVSVAEGSAYPSVRAERFLEATLLVPPTTERDAYEERTMPLRRRSFAAERENLVLARLRDTLLPKLLAGEVRIRDAEEMIGEAV